MPEGISPVTDGSTAAEWVECLLVDGPAAGQQVRVHTDMGTYTHQYYERANQVVTSGPVSPDAPLQGPSIAIYRIGFVWKPGRQMIRVGWCSGKPTPDPDQLKYWLRREPPVKVVAGAESWSFFCDFAIRQDQADATIQGVCRCGWETETVPRRRAKEVLALVNAHAETSISAAQNCARSSPQPES